jgi:hypothetical protein
MNDALREKVLGLMNRHGIGYFGYEGPDGSLTLDAERADDHPPILGRSAGIFLTRHPAGHGVPAWPRRVSAGDILGWLKVGPRLDPVTAEQDGIVRRPRLPDGAIAGFGDRLF